MNEDLGSFDNTSDIFPKSKIHLTIIGFFLLGLFVLSVGVGLFFLKNKSGGDDVQILSAATANSPEVAEIIVDISGAVVAPGVYRLPPFSRVSDAVLLAGGLTDEADRSKVNLAAKVVDGQKINVPTKSEQVISDNGKVISQNNLISINSATEAELDKLPGVGPVTAAKIIASRPYSSPEDLLSKKAVTKSVYEKIKDLISL